MSAAELEPVDLKRCQTEWNEYRPFIMGWNVNQTIRCDKPPDVVVTEGVPGDDGRCGAMSMCDEHLGIFKKKHPALAKTVSVTPIKKS